MDKLGNLLRTNSIAKISELLAVFLVAFVIIKLFLRPDGDHLLFNQGVLWGANIAMLLLVWLGLKLRGESWQDFGLGFKRISFKAALRVFLLSLLVFVLALAGFVVGSIIMANITGIPEAARQLVFSKTFLIVVFMLLKIFSCLLFSVLYLKRY